MRKILKNERGSITVYVIITMLFFTVFVMSIYIMNSRKYAAQLEANANIQAIYSKESASEVFNNRFAKAGEKIPIYTAAQLRKIGSGDRIYIAQEKKIYKFDAINDKYVIKNNITGLTQNEVIGLRSSLMSYVENYGTLSGYYSFYGSTTNILKNE